MHPAHIIRYLCISVGTATAYLFGVIIAIVLLDILGIPNVLTAQILFFAHGVAVLITGLYVYLVWLKWPTRETLVSALCGMFIFVLAVLSIGVHFS